MLCYFVYFVRAINYKTLKFRPIRKKEERMYHFKVQNSKRLFCLWLFYRCGRPRQKTTWYKSLSWPFLAFFCNTSLSNFSRCISETEVECSKEILFGCTFFENCIKVTGRFYYSIKILLQRFFIKLNAANSSNMNHFYSINSNRGLFTQA